jgi:hypothetical protein
MATFKALSRGTQFVLVAGPLLLLSLFFTWQNDPVDYGRSGVATVPLDGWDAWGLLIALLTAAVVSIVVLDEFTEVEMPAGVPWATVTFALGVAVLGIAVLKSITDVGSTWESYAFVGLAAALAAGTYLDWAALRKPDQTLLARKRRGISSAA